MSSPHGYATGKSGRDRRVRARDFPKNLAHVHVPVPNDPKGARFEE